MNSIIVCNTASDSLSIISLDGEGFVDTIPLNLVEGPYGPHGVNVYENKIITANNYGNSISIVDILKKKEVENYFIGSCPNDIKTYNDRGYILCGDSNTVVVFDMKEKKNIFQLKTGNHPHSIDIDSDGIGYISCLDGDSLIVFKCDDGEIIKEIKKLSYPIKVVASKYSKDIFVLESYLGEDKDGYINIISKESLYSNIRIKVGKGPVDMWEDKNYLYISNFIDSSISIVDLKSGKEAKKIYLEGIPRGIIKFKNSIYVGDYINGRVIKINLLDKETKIIAVGKEPNAMILHHHFQKIESL